MLFEYHTPVDETTTALLAGSHGSSLNTRIVPVALPVTSSHVGLADKKSKVRTILLSLTPKTKLPSPGTTVGPGISSANGTSIGSASKLGTSLGGVSG